MLSGFVLRSVIRNPHKFNIKLEMDGQYYNLWSTDNDKTEANDEVVIKSVYDPSPVGYSLPASNAFTGFTTTGQNVGDWSQSYILTTEEKEKFNIKGNFDRGWYCYTKPGKQGILFFFQATGWRVYSTGQQERYSSSGWNWNAGSYSDINGSCFGYKDTTISPFDYNIRSMGQPVRSAEEKE